MLGDFLSGFGDQVEKRQPEDLGPARPVTHRTLALIPQMRDAPAYLVPDSVVGTCGCNTDKTQSLPSWHVHPGGDK